MVVLFRTVNVWLVNFPIFSATQMAQQLEQTNPELITSLRQTMQGGRGQNTEPNENTEDPDQNGKIANVKNY